MMPEVMLQSFQHGAAWVSNGVFALVVGMAAIAFYQGR